MLQVEYLSENFVCENRPRYGRELASKAFRKRHTPYISANWISYSLPSRRNAQLGARQPVFSQR